MACTFVTWLRCALALRYCYGSNHQRRRNNVQLYNERKDNYLVWPGKGIYVATHMLFQSLSSDNRRTMRSAPYLLLIALAFVLLVGFNQRGQAQSYSVIHSFSGGSGGAYPFTGLTIDSHGTIYGTSFGQGGNLGYGTIFSLSDSGGNWTFTTIYSFPDGSDGAGPMSRLAIGPDGDFYGSTSAGGGGSCLTDRGYHGCGTIYKLASLPRGEAGIGLAWSESVLYRFSGTNGAYPQGDLTFQSDGNIYGTAINGGSAGWGLIYNLTDSNGQWNESILYELRNNGDGQYPWGGVTVDPSGNLYGVVSGGGPHGYGAVYKLAHSGSGWEESTIHGFSFHGDDGASPEGGLIIDSSGTLYGSTVHAPTSGGAAFELNSDGGSWNFDSLYGFSGGIGLGPYDKLVMDRSGNLYGTTFGDGQYGYGTVFKLTRSNGNWIYTSLHNFTGGTDGGNPMCSLVFDSSGNLYGTASDGGTFHLGVVFKIVP